MENSGKKGISVQTVNLIMTVISIVISILLLYETSKMVNDYDTIRANTRSYIEWQKVVNEFEAGSDLLMESARSFVNTGESKWVEEYFKEADVTRRREAALEKVREGFGESSSVYRELNAAMNESNELMNRECYAMHLMMEGNDLDADQFPERVQNVKLNVEDQDISPAEKTARARTILNDMYYQMRKDNVINGIHSCMSEVFDSTIHRQERVEAHLDGLLIRERVLILSLILAAVVLLLLINVLIITPVKRSVEYARKNRELPEIGAREFRFLAKTYNTLSSESREQKEKLDYEVSHDSATGLYNESGFRIILKSVKLNTTALILFDVDGFRPIDDRYGHKVSDYVLSVVGNVIRDTFRSQDYVCRTGWDDFAVVMVQTGSQHSDVVLEKVEAINEKLRESVEGVPPIHLSVGVAYGDKYANGDELYKAADAARTRVKENGGRGCAIA
ncbi:MAG: GGDEF domain-containing protein [Clostridia bacterium]|nr:GGDEF domain-containing protein [Clostridia bacterium]